MRIEKSDLVSAAQKVGISERQAESLWVALSGSTTSSEPTKFDLSRVLYYLGAVIVIIAMGWFIGITWDNFGAGGVLIVTLAYMLLFIIIGNVLWRRDDLKTPGGLFITMAVCLIPLVVFSFQRWTGWWPLGDPGDYKNFISWIKGEWFTLEIATIIGGSIALLFYPFPFLTAPIFFSLWFLSMDITPLLFTNPDNIENARLWVSMVFGLVILVVAYVADLKSRKDFAFWGYLFGMIAFWTGLSLLDQSSEYSRLIYCLINIGLIFLSVILQRSVFLIFGAIGVLNYIITIFYKYFSDTPWFPVALSAVGLLFIFIGIIYHKNRQRIQSAILNTLPAGIEKWLPKSKE